MTCVLKSSKHEERKPRAEVITCSDLITFFHRSAFLSTFYDFVTFYFHYWFMFLLQCCSEYTLLIALWFSF